MEDFSQYLVFGLVALAIIISTIRTKKKQAADLEKQSQLPEHAKEKTKDSTSQNWEEWFSQDDKSLFAPPPSIHPTKMVEKKPQINKQTEPKAGEHERLGYEPEIKLTSTEEARRAIIYSEILHRKY